MIINSNYMRLFKNILFFYLCTLTYQYVNCQNTNNIVTFNIKEQIEIDNLKLSELGFSDIDYIPLETNLKSLIKRITGLRICNDFILIQYYTTILKFKPDGSFAHKIGTEGRGPNEFTVVHDIDIDEKNKRIYLVSAWQRKFFVYSENGKFLKTIQSPLNTTNFKVTDDGILCYSINSFGNVTSSFSLIDSIGRVIKSYPNKYPWNPPKRSTYIFQYENLYYRFSNQLFKKEIYSDTIYSFDKLAFEPHLIIDHGKKLITSKVRTNSSVDQITENFIRQLNLFEFGDYIYYEFLLGRNAFSLIGSKKNNSTFIIDPEKGIINDVDCGPNIWPKGIKDDKTLISWIDAIELKKYVASEIFKKSVPKFPEEKKELEKLASSLKETDNPVLVLVRLK